MGTPLPVPAPEERILVATLQRMYRHFYFRLSDILNTSGLVDAGAIDFNELQHAARLGGIWPGVATYLNISSDYVERYRERRSLCPAWCATQRPSVENGWEYASASCGFPSCRKALRCTRGKWGRLPPAATCLLLCGSLLPPLASIAALSYRLTGSDKGIW